MIIRELHIDSFEGLSSRTFPLADGINVICGPNESGKSSLADFIFFMFYGVVSPHGRTAFSVARDRKSRRLAACGAERRRETRISTRCRI